MESRREPENNPGKKPGSGLIRRVVGDSAWSIAGLVLMNVAAQFAVYPVWNRQLGNEAYGRILFLISAMNILAVSMGTACNYGRMKESAVNETRNAAYLKLMGIASAAAVPYMLGVSLISGTLIAAGEMVCLILLTVATLWRFYADVEFRLSLNYRGFFQYYLAITCGYGAGVGLFLLTGLWPLALLPGELAVIAVVARRGRVLRMDQDTDENTRHILRLVVTLLVTEVINNLIFNGDRVLLKLALDGTAVSLYYQASLLGKTMALVATPLNSVLIGYLARYRGGLNRKLMGMTAGGAVGLLALATVGCTLASHILIRLLYAQNYELVRGYFWVANAAQAAYFLSNIAATVLLRYCRIRYQLYINTVYAVGFCALCVPAALTAGLDGFCVALLAVCLLRLATVLGLGYRSALTGKGLAEGTAAVQTPKYSGLNDGEVP